MSGLDIFNRAHELCVRLDRQVIMHDLAMMTETELKGVVVFLLKLQNG